MVWNRQIFRDGKASHSSCIWMSARHSVADTEKFGQREGVAATKKIRKRESVADICRCLPPDTTWHKVKSPMAD